MRLAVFASGAGSNLQAILDAIEDGSLAAEPALVVSDRPTAGALERAARAGVDQAVVEPSHFDDPEEYGAALLASLEEHGVDFVALAGFLRMVPANVIAAYRNRMVNVHPALLPAFGGKGLYGRRVHEAVLEAGVRWTGATVHLVDEHYDTGPIVLQEPVPVRQDDTPESLARRVLEMEHRLYPRALRLFAEDRVRIEGRKVWIGEEGER